MTAVRRKKKNDVIKFSAPARLAAAIAHHPRDFIGIIMIMCVGSAIIINALFSQPRSHPAPIFASAPLFSELSQRPAQSNPAELHLKSEEGATRGIIRKKNAGKAL